MFSLTLDLTTHARADEGDDNCPHAGVCPIHRSGGCIGGFPPLGGPEDRRSTMHLSEADFHQSGAAMQPEDQLRIRLWLLYRRRRPLITQGPASPGLKPNHKKGRDEQKQPKVCNQSTVTHVFKKRTRSELTSCCDRQQRDWFSFQIRPSGDISRGGGGGARRPQRTTGWACWGQNRGPSVLPAGARSTTGRQKRGCVCLPQTVPFTV